MNSNWYVVGTQHVRTVFSDFIVGKFKLKTKHRVKYHVLFSIFLTSIVKNESRHKIGDWFKIA